MNRKQIQRYKDTDDIEIDTEQKVKIQSIQKVKIQSIQKVRIQSIQKVRYRETVDIETYTDFTNSR